MARVTFHDAKYGDERLPQSIGANPEDDRFRALLNQAVRRCLFLGKFWGSCARFEFCVTNGLLTLPRQIATIEAAAMCGRPMILRDYWYEFLENGFGTQSDNEAYFRGGGVLTSNQTIYRGRYPTISNIIGTDKNLLLNCDVPTDAGKVVLVLGYDENGNWVRTTQNGIVCDGEAIPLSQAPGTFSSTFFSSITDIQAPDGLDGQWWLWEYQQSSGTQRLIGHYDYNDTRPAYARYLLPFCPQSSGGGDIKRVPVDIVGKLDFIPVVKDSDYLVIGNLPAIKEMMMALNAAENEQSGAGKVQIISAGELSAKNQLENELDHYLGSGRRIGINVLGSSIGEVDPVPFII